MALPADTPDLSTVGKIAAYFVAHPDAIIAVASVVVAIASLIVAAIAVRAQLSQSKAQRRHDVLTVTPILDLSLEHGVPPVAPQAGPAPQRVYRGDALLRNVGLGPAIITRFRPMVDGVEVDGSTPDPMIQHAKVLFGPTANWCNAFHLNPPGHTGLLPAKHKVLLGVELKVSTDADVDRARAVFERLDCEIEYESVYGQKFVFDTRQQPANRPATSQPETTQQPRAAPRSTGRR